MLYYWLLWLFSFVVNCCFIIVLSCVWLCIDCCFMLFVLCCRFMGLLLFWLFVVALCGLVDACITYFIIVLLGWVYTYFNGLFKLYCFALLYCLVFDGLIWFALLNAWVFVIRNVVLYDCWLLVWLFWVILLHAVFDFVVLFCTVVCFCSLHIGCLNLWWRFALGLMCLLLCCWLFALFEFGLLFGYLNLSCG